MGGEWVRAAGWGGVVYSMALCSCGRMAPCGGIGGWAGGAGGTRLRRGATGTLFYFLLVHLIFFLRVHYLDPGAVVVPPESRKDLSAMVAARGSRHVARHNFIRRVAVGALQHHDRVGGRYRGRLPGAVSSRSRGQTLVTPPCKQGLAPRPPGRRRVASCRSPDQ